jgi:hypothetical protein
MYMDWLVQHHVRPRPKIAAKNLPPAWDATEGRERSNTLLARNRYCACEVYVVIVKVNSVAGQLSLPRCFRGIVYIDRHVLRILIAY